MAHPRYSSAEIAERGQALYESEIRSSLAPSDHGKFLVLDIETGHYELDTDELAAVRRARVQRPDGAFYVLRVGHSAAYRLLSEESSEPLGEPGEAGLAGESGDTRFDAMALALLAAHAERVAEAGLVVPQDEAFARLRSRIAQGEAHRRELQDELLGEDIEWGLRGSD